MLTHVSDNLKLILCIDGVLVRKQICMQLLLQERSCSRLIDKPHVLILWKLIGAG